MSYCVYKHTAPNGKIYVGITSKNPLDRWKNGRAYTNNPHFNNAIQKYGWDNFKHEILFSGLTKEEACKKEIELIAKYKSNEFEYGYNRSTGGERGNEGITITDEIKKKISASLKGRKMSEDQRRRSADAHRGLKRSAEIRRKMSEIAKKRGMSESTRQAIRRPIICVETKEIYPSIIKASEATNISRTAISNCCCGRSKTAGGYSWIYKNLKERGK